MKKILLFFIAQSLFLRGMEEVYMFEEEEDIILQKSFIQDPEWIQSDLKGYRKQFETSDTLKEKYQAFLSYVKNRIKQVEQTLENLPCKQDTLLSLWANAKYYARKLEMCTKAPISELMAATLLSSIEEAARSDSPEIKQEFTDLVNSEQIKMKIWRINIKINNLRRMYKNYKELEQFKVQYEYINEYDDRIKRIQEKIDELKKI